MARRIALAAAIIIVAAVLVLPPVFGARARALLEPGLNAMGESLAPDAAFAVSFDDWDAGWFSSTATVTFEAVFRTPPPVAAVSVDLEETYRTTLPGVVTLHHGPVPLGGPGGLGWGSAEFTIDAAAFPVIRGVHAETGVSEVARLTALVGFLGSTTIGLSLPPVSTTEPSSGTQLHFAGLEATLSLGRDGSRTASTGTLQGLWAITPDDVTFEIGETTWVARADKDPATSLWLGDGSARLAKLVASGTDTAGRLEVDDVQIESDTHVDGDEVVGALRATAVGLRFDEFKRRAAAWSHFQLEDLEVDMMATGPVAAMESLAERASGSLIEMPLTSVMLATIRGHRATLRIDPLAFNYRDMPLRATLDVEYHGGREAEEPVTPDFGEFTRSTSAELELSFHRNLLDVLGIDMVANLLPAMARLELVRESGDEYHVHATYRDGELLFDGKPVDVALLAALMAGT